MFFNKLLLRKPAYSTAGQTSVITTVSSTIPKMSFSYKESGKNYSSVSSSTDVKNPESATTQEPSSSSPVENDSEKVNFEQQETNPDLSNEMSREEKIQLIRDMDNSLEKYGLLTSRKTLAENWNTWQEFYVKPQQTFVVTTLRQEMDSSRKTIENLLHVFYTFKILQLFFYFSL